MLLQRREEAAARAEDEARRTRQLRASVDLRTLPTLPFPQPAQEAYDAVAWPEDPEKQDDSNRGRRRGEPEGPAVVDLSAEHTWAPGPPEKLGGMVTVVYGWIPEWASKVEVFNQMEALQRAHARDVNVVGILTRRTDSNRNRRRSRNGEPSDEERKEIEQAREVFESVNELRRLNHSTIFEFERSPIARAIDFEGRNVQDFNTIGRFSNGSPLVIISSDGRVRYRTLGWVQSSGFRAALEQIIEIDPGVRARRAAEEEYIRSLTE